MKFQSCFIALLSSGVTALAQNELRVPADTAYVEPMDGGVSGWTDPGQKILWFGELKNPGELDCSLELRLPAGVESKLRLTVAGKSREATVTGTSNDLAKANFGAFDIAAPGYQSFTLESLNAAAHPAGDIQTLTLNGPAAVGAHFNLQPGRGRAAASVHLFYPTSGCTNLDAFYCEVTAQETPVWSYFEACGWHRGYLGMQVNSPTERRIIFSV